jgi:hypothetical protein
MGHQAMVYGRIQGERERWDAPGPRVHEYNAAVLRSLPDTDDLWPFLTRHMFGVAEHRLGNHADRGLYRSQVIHFGASLKDEPSPADRWEAWLAKFEQQLLKRLAWRSAIVHIETAFAPVRAYVYRVDAATLEEMLFEIRNFGAAALVSENRWHRQSCEVSGWQQDWLM